jgi:hypothetical protein
MGSYSTDYNDDFDIALDDQPQPEETPFPFYCDEESTGICTLLPNNEYRKVKARYFTSKGRIALLAAITLARCKARGGCNITQ